MSLLRYAVIGHPIGHTMSPFIHSHLFALAGLEAQYEVFDIPPDALGAQAAGRLAQLDGYNITIPHKEGIIPFLGTLDDKAKLYGSVNTVKTSGGFSTGYTTDPDGFTKALANAGIPLAGRIVVLGSGGVARVMIFEAVLAGCEVVIAVRPSDLEKARALADEAAKIAPGAAVSVCLLTEISGDFSLLVNATPVGMFPHADACPVEEKTLSRAASVFDAVYNPAETLLMRKAKAGGAKVLGGMPMLVWQAVVSHEIWNGSRYSAAQIEALCEAATFEMRRKFE